MSSRTTGRSQVGIANTLYTNVFMLSHVHTSNRVEATFNFVEATFDFVAENGNNVEPVYSKISSFRQSRMLLRHCCRFWQQCSATMLPVLVTMSNEISSFRHSLNKLNMFSLFPLCRKDEILFDIVAKTGNIQLCRKNCLTCSIRQCFDIVVGVDGASRVC